MEADICTVRLGTWLQQGTAGEVKYKYRQARKGECDDIEEIEQNETLQKERMIPSFTKRP